MITRQAAMAHESPIAPWVDALQRDFQVTPVLAAELEWYLRRRGETVPMSNNGIILGDLLNGLAEACQQAGLRLHSIERERGPGQMEAALMPDSDPMRLAQDLRRLKLVITDFFHATKRLEADFRAKPFAGEFGSALHIHLHLEDSEGVHLFHKDGETMSAPLRHCLAGLLMTAEHFMPVFAPYENSRQRFVKGFHAPINASWGGNNRTVALRLPDYTAPKEGAQVIARESQRTTARRIEHRIAGSDADPEAVIAAVLEGIHRGLSAQAEPPTPIFGDASHPQYGLRPLFES